MRRIIGILLIVLAFTIVLSLGIIGAYKSGRLAEALFAIGISVLLIVLIVVGISLIE